MRIYSKRVINFVPWERGRRRRFIFRSLASSVCVRERQRSSSSERERGMAAEEGQVISCHTVESWTEQIQKGNDPGKLVVVDFTASWCGPCRIMAPFLADLARRFPSVLFLKVDVDELKTVAQEWAVEAMPTFMFVKSGKIVDKVVGARKSELEETTVKHMTSTASA